MRKAPSFWPPRRRLFRDKLKRSLLATWLVGALSIAAAILLTSYLRHPAV